MQGRRENQKSMYQYVDLDELVPKDYFLREINQAVDFSFIRPLVAPLYSPDNGRPSIDPEVALRMMTLSYLMNLSENRTCAEIHMHAGYLWFCGMDFNSKVPDRTTLVKLRKQWRQAGVFEEIFTQIVKQCMAAGLVNGELLAVDGTVVKARAAINSLEEIHPIPLKDYLAKLRTEDGQDPPDDPPPPRKGGDQDFRGEKFSNESHRSVTDPDARLIRKSKGQEAKLGYLAHNLIDVSSRVIVGNRTTLAHMHLERTAALEMLRESDYLPTPSGKRSFYGDGNYNTASFVASLLSLGYKPFVPMSGGLEPLPVWKTKTRILIRYRNRKLKIELVKARNEARMLCQTGEYSRTYRYRVKIEHTFAEAKEHHGLGRARSYGLACMQEQTNMTATVQNMKRLAKYIWRKGKKAAQALANMLPSTKKSFSAHYYHFTPVFSW